MDLAPEQLQFLTLPELLKESISIPKFSPKTFSLITLTLIFPLSFAIVAHSLVTHPLILQIHSQTQSFPYTSSYPYNDYTNTDTDSSKTYNPSNLNKQYTLLLTYQFCYLIFLFAFSLLSTAAVVFTVASLYTSKPVSFSSTLSAIPPVLKRLFITFLYVTLLMIIYNIVFISSLLILLIAAYTQSLVLFLFSVALVLLLFLGVHVYITALWHLASVITVLEPISGIAAMKKSYELLKGKTQMAMAFVFGYLSICGIIASVFGSVVVRGGEEYGYGGFERFFVGAILVGVLVIVNLIGLLLQSVFYYVCKSYHHQEIDKSALNDHLGGYLGEYVPLKSSIQMESL